MEEFLKALGTGGGIAGIILGFHLWKLAPELRAIWRALDRMNTVRILGIIASPHAAPDVKEAAAEVIKNIEKEEASGKKRESVPP